MGFTSIWKEFNTFFVSFTIAQMKMTNNLINLINLIFRIEHSVHKCGDIQTAAMISCVFDENNQNNNKLNAKINSLKMIHSNGNTNNNLVSQKISFLFAFFTL